MRKLLGFRLAEGADEEMELWDGSRMKEKIITVMLLGICSWQDIRERQISVKLLWCSIAAAILVAVWNVCGNVIAWWEIPVGIIPGGILLIYSHLTDEQLGEADGWIVIATGILLRWRMCMGMLLTACLLVFGASVVLMVLKKGGRQTQLPFVPFLLGGVILTWIGQGNS